MNRNLLAFGLLALFPLPLLAQPEHEGDGRLETSRISSTVTGSWPDEDSWPRTIEQAVDAMTRLHDALADRVDDLTDVSRAG